MLKFRTLTIKGGMGHLIILIWIKVHYDLNIFTGLKYSNPTTFNKRIWFKIFFKDKKN